MAIFHLDFKIVKRSEGMTSVAKAAYHARTRITDDRIGETFDFSHRTDLHGHIILAPLSTPAHIIESSSALWNEVERVERQNNGQTARYFDVAIPVELNNDDKKKLVAEYCQKNFVDKGMIADIVFHDLDSKNPHAHVMLTLKTIGPEGFGKKDRSWNDKKIMIQWRESWATMSNSYLEAAGSEERIDHRSLRTQCADALAHAEEAFSAEEKAFWLAKATETNRPAMFIVLNGMTKSLRNSELLNKLNAIIKLKRPRRSTPHSVSYHWKSLLMSEALRLHILLNPKRLFFQTTRQQ